MSGQTDIHDEIASARRALAACPRWRVLRRRDLRDELEVRRHVLRVFEDALLEVRVAEARRERSERAASGG